MNGGSQHRPGVEQAMGLPGALVPGDVPPRLIARILGASYVFGAIPGLIVISLPGVTNARPSVIYGLGALMLVLGTVLLAGGVDRTSRRLIVAVHLATLGLLAVGVAAAGSAGAPLIMFFLWTSPYVWCFFSRRVALVLTMCASMLAFAGLAVGAGALRVPSRLYTEPVLGVWIMATSTLITLGLLTRWLVRHLLTFQLLLRDAFAAAPVGLVAATADGRVGWANEGFARLLGLELADVRGRRLIDFVVADERVSARSQLADDGPTEPYRRRLLHSSGRELLAEVTRTTVSTPSGRYHFAYVRDITNEAAASARRDQLAALVEAGDELVAMADADQRLLYLNNAGRQLLGYPDGELSDVAITDFLTAEDAAGFADVVLPRMREGDVVQVRARYRTASGELVPMEGSSFIIPSAPGRAMALATVLRDQRPWDAARAELDALHEQRLRLLQEVVSAAEAERHRIARDVHDDPVQVMAAVEIRLQMLQRHLRGMPERAAEVGDLRKTAAAATQRLRALAFELEPTAAGRSLDEAIRIAARDIFAGTSVTVDINTEGSGRCPDQIAITLYRIAREALVNVHKHAEAEHVVVRLTLGEEIGLTVDDDGTGTDVGVLGAPGHLGVVDMRERTDLVGGEFSMERSALGGVRIAVHVPAVNSVSTDAHVG